jgi:hypothetical protein
MGIRFPIIGEPPQRTSPQKSHNVVVERPVELMTSVIILFILQLLAAEHPNEVRTKVHPGG